MNILYTKGEIAAQVRRLGLEITRDYKHKNPLILVVLNGAFIFGADLVRRLHFPLEVEFVQVSSYDGDKSRELRVEGVVDVGSREVLIIEDIVDTGRTAEFLLHAFPYSTVNLCTLLSKPARRTTKVPIDYIGFVVPDKFVVGYGMDYNGKYRNLLHIGWIE